MAYVGINLAHDQGAMKFAEDVAVIRWISVRVFATVQGAEKCL